MILTTYFTSKSHPLYGTRAPADSIRYIGPWYVSMRRLGLAGVVFHDGLSDAFVRAHETERLRFRFEDPAGFVHSLNDHRFFVYRRFLEERPEIERLFMTDANDLAVVQDPFPYLEPDRVYVGHQDGRLHPPEPADGSYAYQGYAFVSRLLRQAGPAYHAWFENLAREVDRETFPVLNAGILGGRRRPVLEVLERLTAELRVVAKPGLNLNMGLLNHVLYRNFARRIVTGPPVHSAFGHRQRDRRDVWFVHK